MAVPKKKTSGARRDSRRSSNSKLTAPGLVQCPKCKELVLAHHVCKACGSYDGKEVIKTGNETAKK
jgi:large subunit ribosomal protein L32